LRTVSVGDDHTPVHFEKIDNVAHDSSENLGCITSLIPRGLQSVSTQCVDSNLSHTQWFLWTVLTLCTTYMNRPCVLMFQEGDIHIG